MSIYGEGQYANPRTGEAGIAPPLRPDEQLQRRDWEVRGDDGGELAPEPTAETKVLNRARSTRSLSATARRRCSRTGAAYGMPRCAALLQRLRRAAVPLEPVYRRGRDLRLAAAERARAARLRGRAPVARLHRRPRRRPRVALALTTSGGDGEAINVGSGRPASVPRDCGHDRPRPWAGGRARRWPGSSAPVTSGTASRTHGRRALGFNASIASSRDGDLLAWLEGQEATDSVETAHEALVSPRAGALKVPARRRRPRGRRPGRRRDGRAGASATTISRASSPRSHEVTLVVPNDPSEVDLDVRVVSVHRPLPHGSSSSPARRTPSSAAARDLAAWPPSPTRARTVYDLYVPAVTRAPRLPLGTGRPRRRAAALVSRRDAEAARARSRSATRSSARATGSATSGSARCCSAGRIEPTATTRPDPARLIDVVPFGIDARAAAPAPGAEGRRPGSATTTGPALGGRDLELVRPADRDPTPSPARAPAATSSSSSSGSRHPNPVVQRWRWPARASTPAEALGLPDRHRVLQRWAGCRMSNAARISLEADLGVSAHFDGIEAASPSARGCSTLLRRPAARRRRW